MLITDPSDLQGHIGMPGQDGETGPRGEKVVLFLKSSIIINIKWCSYILVRSHKWSEVWQCLWMQCDYWIWWICWRDLKQTCSLIDYHFLLGNVGKTRSSWNSRSCRPKCKYVQEWIVPLYAQAIQYVQTLYKSKNSFNRPTLPNWSPK